MLTTVLSLSPLILFSLSAKMLIQDAEMPQKDDAVDSVSRLMLCVFLGLEKKIELVLRINLFAIGRICI